MTSYDLTKIGVLVTNRDEVYAVIDKIKEDFGHKFRKDYKPDYDIHVRLINSYHRIDKSKNKRVIFLYKVKKYYEIDSSWEDKDYKRYVKSFITSFDYLNEALSPYDFY